MRHFVAIAAALTACTPTPSHYNQFCDEPYGVASDGEVKVSSDGAFHLRLVLSPAMSKADLDGATLGCLSWGEAIRVTCDVYRDDDWVPDAGAIPVHRCVAPRYAEGSSGVTYPSDHGMPEIVINANVPVAHRRLVAHELGHVLHLPDQSCAQGSPSIMVPGGPCMAQGPTDFDGKRVRALWR